MMFDSTLRAATVQSLAARLQKTALRAKHAQVRFELLDPTELGAHAGG